MDISIYNTLTKKKEKLVPMHPGKINMFVCGPTVYDFSHLGHAKTYTQFDFVVRYLRKKGFQVFYLQNITDIDDKIIKRAHELKMTPKALALKYEAAYKQDMLSLGNTSVSEFARATDHIPMIIKQIKDLISKGVAYEISDGYYFDLKKFSDYGKLSGRTTLQDDDAVSRVDENTEKRNKGDFCLWKAYKEGDPFWGTDLGKGRPGWHIEDTAITEAYFGQQYDLHGGAVDLIFPHHEAEIAQQEAASGKKPFVKYWMHTAFLNTNAEKMSKSKGNFLTIRKALEQYDAAVFRFLFISNHYRTSMDFSPEILEQAKNGLERLNEFIRRINKKHEDNENIAVIDAFRNKFYAHLDDDFNTPLAFAELFELVRVINSKGNAGKQVLALMEELNEIFGFLKLEEDELPTEIIILGNKREDARGRKDWAESDRLRDEIASKGYIVKDTKDGPKITKA
jgi:cysteinyl-tRNA synthetase